ncbi:MAG TPA: hypothetical protein DDW52_08245, partial [Planctomycetaceae bacterium]|nr:hypothetical protein [Planctomycetaceae bacterium]
PREIRTYQDVIHAFHSIALSAGHRTRPWWTYKRAVDELSGEQDSSRRAWEALARIYEEGRYVGVASALPAEKAKQAEHALKTLEQAVSHA